MQERKILSIDPLKCNGCKDCERACSMSHAVANKCPGPRIEVLGEGANGNGFHVPQTCQQCINPPCLRACPKNAISRDSELERVVLDDTLCVGCRMCVSACPSGAMGFDAELGLAYKCDLCDGNPQCAGACKQSAISFVGASHLNYPRMINSASRFLHTMKERVAAGARRA